MNNNRIKDLKSRLNIIMDAIDGLKLEEALSVLSSSIGNALVCSINKGLSVEAANRLIETNEEVLKQLINKQQESKMPSFEVNQ